MIPVSFYAVVSFLWLCSAIRQCLSLSLSPSLSLCVSCVRARLSASPQFILGTPVVSVRHRAAWTHSGTAKRSGGETEIPNPPPLFFYPLSFPPIFIPLSFSTPLTPTHTHACIHIYKLHMQKNTQPSFLFPPIWANPYSFAHIWTFIGNYGSCMWCVLK